MKEEEKQRLHKSIQVQERKRKKVEVTRRHEAISNLGKSIQTGEYNADLSKSRGRGRTLVLPSWLVQAETRRLGAADTVVAESIVVEKLPKTLLILGANAAGKDHIHKTCLEIGSISSLVEMNHGGNIIYRVEFVSGHNAKTAYDTLHNSQFPGLPGSKLVVQLVDE
mmetsp:Transcript_39197/g.63614  ORF Transcript_39197/g.63614 Transcript_39197/m.63614 type:complete len:167 (+) Transcript_39197:318-818(+)